MTLDEFQRAVVNAALASPICDVPVVRRTSSTSINLRIEVSLGGIIDAFYNEQTGTTAYAWVRDGSRVFGIDNTGGWHLHPLEDPTRHDSLPGLVAFGEFIAQLEQLGR